MGAILAAFGGSLPPGVTGTNDRCTLLVTNFDPEVSPLVLLGFLPIPFKLYLIIWNYILLQKIDEDKLFNLFSIYGNIVRIKLLRNKPDHALIQMGDGFQAELAVHFLKVCFLLIFLAILFFNCYLFGRKKKKRKRLYICSKKIPSIDTSELVLIPPKNFFNLEHFHVESFLLLQISFSTTSGYLQYYYLPA